MNDSTWSSITCGIPDRLRSTCYARLQQCRSAHPPVTDENADSNEWLRRLEGRATARMAQYERDRQDLEREELSARIKAAVAPPAPAGEPMNQVGPNPIPQPEPERRDGPPWGLLAFGSVVFWAASLGIWWFKS